MKNTVISDKHDLKNDSRFISAFKSKLFKFLVKKTYKANLRPWSDHKFDQKTKFGPLILRRHSNK